MLPKIKSHEIEEIYIGDDRYYQSSDNWCYPSITSLLSNLPEKQHAIEMWKGYLLKTGLTEKEAEKIMAQKRLTAAKRGIEVHEMAQKYFLEGREPFQITSVEDQLFSLLRPELDCIKLKNINNRVMCEEVVWSHKLGVAGRLDYLGFYNDTLSIIDIKTTEKLKPKSQRESWYIQACFYALAVFEMYDILAEQIIILNPAEDLKLRIYKEEIYDYTTKLEEVIKNHKEKQCEQII